MNGTIFAHRLRAARERAGITQKQLGINIGIDETVASARINRYEQQSRQPHIDTVAKISVALQVSSSYFYEGNDTLADIILLLSNRDAADLQACQELLRKKQRRNKPPA